MQNITNVISLSVVSLIFIGVLIYLFNKFSSVRDVIVKLASITPDLISITEGFVTKGNPTESQKKFFDLLKQIAQDSAKVVEQIAQKTDIHGDDKKKLAIEYFESLSKSLGIDLNELDQKTAEALIENAVKIMNEENNKTMLLK